MHDSSFTGYVYNYSERTINMSLVNTFRGIAQSIALNNIILFQLQSCSFWGGGNAIYDTNCYTEHQFLNQLRKAKEENLENFEGSRLDMGIEYIVFELTLNSGDVMHVVCESIDYEERPANCM